MKIIVLLVTLATPAAAQDYAEFQTPSGNIHCVMYGDDEFGPPGVRCDMVELEPSYTAPPPDCELDWGSSFYIDVEADIGVLTCHGDTVILPTMSKLAYGKSLSVGGNTCISERSGVTCTNPAGHGFTISRASQRLF
ncbi:MAG: DUF6636 domain-containing protein [Paracoccaceae bacterium]